MSYQLYDNGASIKVNFESGPYLLMKHAIDKISVTSYGMIKIELKEGKVFWLNYAQVTVPVVGSAPNLIQQLNTWIATCLLPPPPNPEGK